MKKELNKNNVMVNKNILFYIALGIYLIATIIDSSFFCRLFPDVLVKISMFITAFLIIIKELTTSKISYKELVYLIVCMILTILTLYHMNHITILPLFFLIYGARNIELDEVLKFIQYLTLTLLLIIIASAKLGIIQNYITYGADRVREYLGFRYALFPQMYIFNISAISLYRHRKEISIPNILMLTALNYIIYQYTASRLSFYLYIILLVGYILLNIKRIFRLVSNGKVIKRILIISYILAAGISIYVTTKYDPTNYKLNEINTILEGRLYLGKNAINNYGIKLLGNKVYFHGNGLGRDGTKSSNHYDYVDSLYLVMTIRYGLIFLIIYLAIHTVALINISKKNEIFLLFILSVIALHGIIDDLELELYYNSFWFAIGNNIILKRKKVLGCDMDENQN